MADRKFSMGRSPTMGATLYADPEPGYQLNDDWRSWYLRADYSW